MPGLPPPITPWSWLTTYPGGPNPWNGQPLGVAPAGTYVSPNTKLSAENFNYIMGQRDLQVALVLAGEAGIANDWQQEWDITTNFASGYVMGTYWDSYNGWWMPFGSKGIDVFVYYTRGMDLDQRWAKLGGASPTTHLTAMAVGIDPAHTGGPLTGTYWAVGVNDDGANNGIIYGYKCVAGTWSLGLVSGVASLLTDVQTVAAGQVGASLVVGVGCNTTVGAGKSAIFPYTAGTWAPKIDTGTDGVAQFLISTNYANNLMVLMESPILAGPGPFPYRTTTDGITFTVRSFTPAGISATAAPVCMCFTTDSSGPCFLVGVFDSGTGKMLFYRSGDGVAWTTLSTPITPFSCTSLAAVGSLVMGALLDNGIGDGAGSVFSPDGGATWYGSSSNLFASSVNTNAYYIKPTMVSSGLRAMFFGNKWSRFSMQAGLPMLPL